MKKFTEELEIEPLKLLTWLDDQHVSWKTYASSTISDKKFQCQLASECFRVLHGSEIVYEGDVISKAVDCYNSIVGKPTCVPKLDN